MYSHVLLSQPEAGSKEDGILEAWEIMKLDMNAELVVLSACETARGRVRAGEGSDRAHLGLICGRVPRDSSEQWKVEAESTTQLMVEFHRHLRAKIENSKSRMTKAEALRQAALKLLASQLYRHRLLLGGFVIIGDAR